MKCIYIYVYIIIYLNAPMWAPELSRASRRFRQKQVSRVVDSYSLGRIHRIALLDKEWHLGEWSPGSGHHFMDVSGRKTGMWKTWGLILCFFFESHQGHQIPGGWNGIFLTHGSVPGSAKPSPTAEMWKNRQFWRIFLGKPLLFIIGFRIDDML